MAKILVIDDEMGIRELLSEILDDEGHEITLANNAEQGRIAQARGGFDLILLDIWMPDTDGLTLLKEWVAAQLLRCPVVMMSGHATIDTAVEATALGAIDFLEKPISMHRLLAAVHKALRRGAEQAMKAMDVPALPTASVANEVNQLQQFPSGQDDVPALDAKLLEEISQLMPAAAPALATQAVPSVGGLDEWQAALAAIDLSAPLREARDHLETIYFTHLLQREQWAISKVADISGLERTHLYRKLKALNIDIPRHNKPTTS